MTKGYVQVYTGDGKGKTTAAVGLAVRAAGAGLRVYFGQFLKDVPCCAVKALSDRFPEITVRQFGSGKGLLLGRDEKEEDRECAQRGFVACGEAIRSQVYDLVIFAGARFGRTSAFPAGAPPFRGRAGPYRSGRRRIGAESGRSGDRNVRAQALFSSGSGRPTGNRGIKGYVR